MPTQKLSRLLTVPLVLGLAILACGPTSTPEAPPTTAPEPTARPTVTPPAAAAPTQPPANLGGISSFKDVAKVTIQILAQGTFYEPQAAQPNAQWAGSGFLISADGLAVTNNHVVTGAARLKALLDGKEYNAKVLGASECSDLAVIQLEGENFPFLSYYEGAVDPGLEVYAAGFPLGDPQYTLTKGIVSKAKADGETNWASVASVIQHDATINPGNSGGPLVDANGQLVGINYAGNSKTNQYFAIKAQDAHKIIEQLAGGSDVDSIGINGQALVWDNGQGGQNTGIWVASVKSGSPADNAGVQPGDILTTMEGLSLAQNGTMAEYCDVIRSHKATDTLSIEVLRYGTQEVLAGQLNGRTLAVTYSFANQLSNDVPASGNSGSSGGADVYSGYKAITDKTGAIKVEVPNEWGDIYTDPDLANANSSLNWAQVRAAPDLKAYGDYTQPGMDFWVSKDLAQIGGYVQVLDILKESYGADCKFKSRNDYSDSAYEGQYDVFTQCKGTDDVLVVLSARPKQNQTAFLMVVMVNILTDKDLKAFDQITQTFDVIDYSKLP